MALQIGYCPYRLLFKRPFGTAHGLRDGTDALFLRLEENGICGYGEVTLPPYVKETIPEAIARIEGIAKRGLWSAGTLIAALDELLELNNGGPGCRAAIHMALVDLIGKQHGMAASAVLGITGTREPVTLMTIGICNVNELEARLSEVPASGALKMKVGDPEASIRIERIMALDNRRLFLDGNQGFSTQEQVENLLALVGTDRLLGLEQPFPTALDSANRALGALVYGDESIQNANDLETSAVHFGGVNLKLMKCGGLDRAVAMASRARELGLSVMLGSMSESSLGCTAMAHLSRTADILDLDGPWLICNDPFIGLHMMEGRMVMPDWPGLGAELRADLDFRITQNGA
jgi:L-Ala-D/L-Glu epimerase